MDSPLRRVDLNRESNGSPSSHSDTSTDTRAAAAARFAIPTGLAGDPSDLGTRQGSGVGVTVPLPAAGQVGLDVPLADPDDRAGGGDSTAFRAVTAGGNVSMAVKIPRQVQRELDELVARMQGIIRETYGDEIRNVRIDFTANTYIFESRGEDISYPIADIGDLREPYERCIDIIENDTPLNRNCTQEVTYYSNLGAGASDEVRQFTAIDTKKNTSNVLEHLLEKRFNLLPQDERRAARKVYENRKQHARHYKWQLIARLAREENAKLQEVAERLEHLDEFALSLALAYLPIGQNEDKDRLARHLTHSLSNDMKGVVEKANKAAFHRLRVWVGLDEDKEFGKMGMKYYAPSVASLILDVKDRKEHYSVEQMVLDGVMAFERGRGEITLDFDVPPMAITRITGPLPADVVARFHGAQTAIEAEMNNTFVQDVEEGSPPQPRRQTAGPNTAAPQPGRRQPQLTPPAPPVVPASQHGGFGIQLDPASDDSDTESGEDGACVGGSS